MHRPLNFPSISYGTHQTPHDLRVFAYPGAAALRVDIAASGLAQSLLGPIDSSRLPLLSDLHAAILYQLQLGRSEVTVVARIEHLRRFYIWADEQCMSVTHETVERAFYGWVEHLIYRITIQKSFKQVNAWRVAASVDRLISSVLDLELGLIRNTRLTSTTKAKHPVKKSDKTNLSDAFKYGHALLDIVNGLPLEIIYGKLPILINLRDGNTLVEWCRLKKPEDVKSLLKRPSRAAYISDARKRWEDEHSLRTRYAVINLRIEAELLIFISQTSMNLAQAIAYTRGQFRFQSNDDAVNVFRAYKGRRGGEVEFRVFKEYASIFKKYLAWLDAIFGPDEMRLFPFYHPHKLPSKLKRHTFQAIESRLTPLGYKIFKPTALRNLKVNWLLRQRLTPGIVSEMAQHTEETLLQVYEKPHHQTATMEITRFLKESDPSLTPAGPGACSITCGPPSPIENTPKEAPKPDCINASGCLFCFFHRDVDSLDYMWTLATLRYCKMLELETYISPEKKAPAHPAHATIKRISEKLNAIAASSKTRSTWVVEAMARVAEANYHPSLNVTIQLLEERA
ncbi:MULTISPECIES: hypothetical protein [Pseudomonas]|uniref:hypothetical protein n=1 Tax=Pseudomonas TaxID=286 RepID=UPI0014497E33|nr:MULTISPECIES: hypothetical protein [Pseudomonas]MBP2274275.1 hypothetical protein [Pseudomonas sp. BP6]MBP2286754.1 hypothetical protein [Pseudomonas sp. BP7]QIZ23104.1 Hypothetical protein [Pseudomonas putida]QKL10069.1 hypothetical protein GEV41_28170 [Pseudomonas putida]WVM66938.1 hypothetical protein V1687_26340 [Pseudomonas putida]